VRPISGSTGGLRTVQVPPSTSDAASGSLGVNASRVLDASGSLGVNASVSVDAKASTSDVPASTSDVPASTQTTPSQLAWQVPRAGFAQLAVQQVRPEAQSCEISQFEPTPFEHPGATSARPSRLPKSAAQRSAWVERKSE
jgi:hypothetical protein